MRNASQLKVMSRFPMRAGAVFGHRARPALVGRKTCFLRISSPYFGSRLLYTVDMVCRSTTHIRGYP